MPLNYDLILKLGQISSNCQLEEKKARQKKGKKREKKASFTFFHICLFAFIAVFKTADTKVFCVQDTHKKKSVWAAWVCLGSVVLQKEEKEERWQGTPMIYVGG